MPDIIKFILTIVLLIAAGVLLWYGYDEHGREWLENNFSVTETTVYIESVPLTARVADTPDERAQGLSGVSDLEDLEVMLFVFPESDRYGIWMKDMRMPLDIIWVSQDLKIVHIEENVSPSTYPGTTFYPPEPAKYVIEGNAFLAESINANVGDPVTIPARFTDTTFTNLQN